MPGQAVANRRHGIKGVRTLRHRCRNVRHILKMQNMVILLQIEARNNTVNRSHRIRYDTIQEFYVDSKAA